MLEEDSPQRKAVARAVEAADCSASVPLLYLQSQLAQVRGNVLGDLRLAGFQGLAQLHGHLAGGGPLAGLLLKGLASCMEPVRHPAGRCPQGAGPPRFR